MKSMVSTRIIRSQKNTKIIMLVGKKEDGMVDPAKKCNNLYFMAARKYDYNSYLRVNFTNLVLFLMFKTGFPPEKIKTTHNTLLNLPNDNYK